MKISVISLSSRIKMYFDITCPATWASLKIIRRDYKSVDIDLVPISDMKIKVAKQRHAIKESSKNIPWNGYYSRPKRPIEEIENEAALEELKIKSMLKDCPSGLEPELKENWKRIYENIVTRGALLPIIFLTGVKMHFPDYFLPAIYKIGTRIWEDELPAHKGCYLSTCAREIGLELRESEFIISNLPHQRIRKELENRCRELIENDLYSEEKKIIPEENRLSPVFILPSTNNSCFRDVYQLKNFV